MDLQNASFPVRYLWYFSRTLYVIITNIICIPSYITWMIILMPLKYVAPHLYWSIERTMFKGLLGVVCIWIDSGGYKIFESGDDLRYISDGKAIILVNHQSTSDVPVVMAALQNKDMLIGHVMWIMDYVFKFTNFGWVSWFHGDFFLLQGRDHREQQLEKLKKHLKEFYMTTFKKYVILFPEGGFLRKRLSNSQKYAKKNGYPVLNHLTLPRLGALQSVIETLNPPNETNGYPEGTNTQRNQRKEVEWIVDMTIGYPNAEALDLHGMCIGYWQARTISVHYRIYPLSGIPTYNTEDFTAWLYKMYESKEKMLDNYYNLEKPLHESDTEKRNIPKLKPHVIEFETLARVLYHVFFPSSFYLFYSYLFSPILSNMIGML